MDCYNQIWQDGRAAFTEITLQVMITLPQLGHMTNIYDYLYSRCPKIAKLGRLVVQYALRLARRGRLRHHLKVIS